MKKFLRPIVSGGILAALLCMPSLAAEPAGCTLLVNGEPAAFADALPAQDGEQLYLPAVNILEALDYEVTWDEASQTITARRDGAEYALTVGENIVSYSRPSWSEVSEDGSSGSAGASAGSTYLSSAPYVDPTNWRTYVPAEFVTEALGCRLTVEDNTEYTFVEGEAENIDGEEFYTFEFVPGPARYTVILDDVDAILGTNTETYQLMDQYMEYAQRYSEGTYQVKGSVAMEVEDPSNSMGVNGDYNMVTSQTALQFDTDLAIHTDMDGLEIILPSVDLDLRCDVETGKFYFKSEALAASDTWYSLDMKELYDMMYGPGFYEELIALDKASVDMTFGESLEAILRSDTLPLSSQFTTTDYLALFNYLFGDSAFVRSGSTYTSTPIDLTEEGTHVLVQFQLFTSGGRVNGYGMELSLSGTEEDEASLTLETEMRKDRMEMAMDLRIPDMTMTMDLDGTYRSTGSAPVTEPPAGAQVVDLMDSFTGGYYQTEQI